MMKSRNYGIVTAMESNQQSEIKHGKIRVGFTDEEMGRGRIILMWPNLALIGLTPVD
jgi:hypothetical protein